MLLSGIARFVVVTASSWVVGGLGTWLVAPANSIHLGASVLVFGWLTYLLARGVLNRSLGQIALSIVLLVIYGSVLWGVLPGAPGHLVAEGTCSAPSAGCSPQCCWPVGATVRAATAA